MKKINLKIIIELTCRLYVSFFLLTYGFAKFIGGQFYSATTIPDAVAITPIVEVSNFDLERARMYKRKNWAPDNTINMEAWEKVARPN